MIIYGIKNCDTMQKAFKFLEKKKKAYTFHNYKTEGIDKAKLKTWLEHFPADRLINTKGTTYRSLSEEAKAGIKNKTKAIALMLENPSMIKRPLVELDNGYYLLGFEEAEWNEKLK